MSIRSDSGLIFTVVENGKSLCWCDVIDHGDGWYLMRLYCSPSHRRCGHAGKLVRHIQRLADVAGKPLFLEPSRFSDGPMNDRKLVEWYRRLGFEHGDELMVRQPLVSGRTVRTSEN